MIGLSMLHGLVGLPPRATNSFAVGRALSAGGSRATVLPPHLLANESG